MFGKTFITYITVLSALFMLLCTAETDPKSDRSVLDQPLEWQTTPEHSILLLKNSRIKWELHFKTARDRAKKWS